MLSCIQCFPTPQTVARQAPLSMGFSRQECWSGLPFPPPGDLPDPGIEPASPALAGRFFTNVPPGKPHKPLVPWLKSLLRRWSGAALAGGRAGVGLGVTPLGPGCPGGEQCIILKGCPVFPLAQALLAPPFHPGPLLYE